jgi:branched-chain amino acid transport system ATP-binding protein
MSLLEVENLHVSYGPIEVVHGVSLAVGQGEVVALLGANGAGKSTTLGAASGLLRAKSGRITFQGKDITRLPAAKRVSLGVTLVPEGRRIFANLTVLENILLGAYLELNPFRRKERLERVYALFPRLAERRKQIGGTLSGGEQQMLAIGRALMADPKLLLLDEPSLGLAPFLITDIFKKIQEMNREGLTILLVEQNVHKSLEICQRAFVMETGNIVAEGTPEELMKDELLRNAYLGVV